MLEHVFVASITVIGLISLVRLYSPIYQLCLIRRLIHIALVLSALGMMAGDAGALAVVTPVAAVLALAALQDFSSEVLIYYQRWVSHGRKKRTVG